MAAPSRIIVVVALTTIQPKIAACEYFSQSACIPAPVLWRPPNLTIVSSWNVTRVFSPFTRFVVQLPGAQ